MQAVLGNTSRHGVAREAGAEGVGDARSPVGVGGDGESALEGTGDHEAQMGNFPVFRPAKCEWLFLRSAR
jgi:hypothetical protein